MRPVASAGRRGSWWPVLAALWLGSLAPLAVAAVDAVLSAAQVVAGQTLELTIREQGPPPAGTTDDLAVDLLPVLLDFHLVSQTAGVDPLNGHRELRLVLLPRRSGLLTVPGLRVGDTLTPELRVQVAATTTTNSRLLPAPAGLAPPTPVAAPAGPLTVSATVSPTRVWLGQQVLLVVTVRGTSAPDGLLHPPQPAAAQLVGLGDARRSEPASGNTPAWEVYERRYAVFPRVAGVLAIPPIAFTDALTDVEHPREAVSAALTVEVLAPPADAGAGPWLPARAVRIGEAGPAAVRMAPGQGLERMLTLSAEGLLAEDLPALVLDIPAGVQTVADPPRLWNERGPDGVVGHRLERVLVTAAAAGEYRFKTAPVRWWNTQAGAFQLATLSDWVLTAAPFASANRRATPSWRPGGLALPPEVTGTTPAGAAMPWWQRPWTWGLLALAAGVLVVLWRG